MRAISASFDPSRRYSVFFDLGFLMGANRHCAADSCLPALCPNRMLGQISLTSIGATVYLRRGYTGTTCLRWGSLGKATGRGSQPKGSKVRTPNWDPASAESTAGTQHPQTGCLASLGAVRPVDLPAAVAVSSHASAAGATTAAGAMAVNPSSHIAPTQLPVAPATSQTSRAGLDEKSSQRPFGSVVNWPAGLSPAGITTQGAEI